MAENQTSASSHQQVRLMMWIVPRTASTVLTKCLSFIEDSLIFFEPYSCARLFGPDAATKNERVETFRKDASQATLTERGYEESQCSFKWVKEQLEASHTGKKFIFCKDMAHSITDHREFLPKGYQHVFLIRHPLKVFPSWKKMNQYVMKVPVSDYRLNQLPSELFPKGYGFKEMSSLINLLEKAHDQKAIIIDTDDLLQDPGGTLSALFKIVGLPFETRLLHWNAGDEITQKWVIPKLFLQGNEVAQYYENAFNTTGFSNPGPLPDRSSLSSDILHCVDASMPYYEKMYAQRLTPKHN